MVNEQQIDLLLEMLKSADTTSEENHAENQTLHELEGSGGREGVFLMSAILFVHKISKKQNHQKEHSRAAKWHKFQLHSTLQ